MVGQFLSLNSKDFVSSGAMSPAVFELLAQVLRPILPKDILLRQSHILRKGKCGDDSLPRGSKPRLQIFPYRSDSKRWSLFVSHTDLLIVRFTEYYLNSTMKLRSPTSLTQLKEYCL